MKGEYNIKAVPIGSDGKFVPWSNQGKRIKVNLEFENERGHIEKYEGLLCME